jgi:heme/copper-type cytochrome/quinol oxidase subunit 2
LKKKEKLKLKWNENLIYTFLTYLFINGAFIFHATTLNGGSSLGYVYILPIFWLIAIIIIGIFAYSKRKILFEKNTKRTSILLIILCTPIPYIILVQIFGLIFSLG